MSLLFKLAEEAKVGEKIEAMFAGVCVTAQPASCRSVVMKEARDGV